MSSDFYYGWEPLYATVKSNIRHEADLIMVLTHWYLTKQSFRCLGVGEDRILMSNETSSELLPELWNANDQTYTLRYIRNGKLYLLAGTIYLDDKKIIINLIDVNSYNVGVVTINYKEEVKSIIGSLSYMIPNVQEVVNNMKLNLIEQVIQDGPKGKIERTESGTQTMRTIPSPMAREVEVRSFLIDTENDPLYNVGRSDLDPLYRGGGGGMLLPPPGSSRRNPPFGGPRLDPHLRRPPPGARFDPIFPNPSRGSFPSNPNPDHMRPLPDDDNIYY